MPVDLGATSRGDLGGRHVLWARQAIYGLSNYVRKLDIKPDRFWKAKSIYTTRTRLRTRCNFIQI